MMSQAGSSLLTRVVLALTAIVIMPEVLLWGRAAADPDAIGMRMLLAASTLNGDVTYGEELLRVRAPSFAVGSGRARPRAP